LIRAAKLWKMRENVSRPLFPRILAGFLANFSVTKSVPRLKHRKSDSPSNSLQNGAFKNVVIIRVRVGIFG
jgi:hypothetical protein